MKEKINKKDVLIGAIGRKLDCDVWFDKHEFSAKTNINIQCTGSRLKKLVDAGQLDQEGGLGKKSLYKMSAEQKAMMIEEGKSNAVTRGRKVFKAAGSKKLIEAEIAAYMELAERLLRSVGFI
jgi:hypothetical protein